MYTILGSKGFIGSNLLKHLEETNQECFAAPRDFVPSKEKNLGHVFYCIGLTADFRSRLFETIDAHVTHLMDFLNQGTFESFLYLSTTRLYVHSSSTREDDPIIVNSSEPDDLYNISKLLGEAICLGAQNKNVKVVRLSNVVGNNFESNNFLSDLIKSAVEKHHIKLQSHPRSEKDYIDISSVVDLLPKILLKGSHRIYNVASGHNTTHEQLVEKIKSETGCTVSMNSSGPKLSFPSISVERLKSEFDLHPLNVIDMIPQMMRDFKNLREHD